MKKATILSHREFKSAPQSGGFASIEAVVLFTVFLLMISYSVGFFGVIHSSILHSIGARNYAFETFRHRSNVTYFRTVTGTQHYKKKGIRYHAVVSERQNDENGFQAATRPIAIGRSPAETNRKNSDMHNSRVPSLRPGQRNERIEVSPVWIKVRYGICIDLNCGDG